MRIAQMMRLNVKTSTVRPIEIYDDNQHEHDALLQHSTENNTTEAGSRTLSVYLLCISCTFSTGFFMLVNMVYYAACQKDVNNTHDEKCLSQATVYAVVISCTAAGLLGGSILWNEWYDSFWRQTTHVAIVSASILLGTHLVFSAFGPENVIFAACILYGMISVIRFAVNGRPAAMLPVAAAPVTIFAVISGIVQLADGDSLIGRFLVQCTPATAALGLIGASLFHGLCFAPYVRSADITSRGLLSTCCALVVAEIPPIIHIAFHSRMWLPTAVQFAASTIHADGLSSLEKFTLISQIFVLIFAVLVNFWVLFHLSVSDAGAVSELWFLAVFLSMMTSAFLMTLHIAALGILYFLVACIILILPLLLIGLVSGCNVVADVVCFLKRHINDAVNRLLKLV